MSRAAAWFLAALLAVPATVLLHELAHFAAAIALGFHDPRFHPMGIDFVAGDYPTGHRVAVTAAGFLTTAILTLTAAGVALRRPGPIPVAVCLAAPLRALAWLPIAGAILRGEAGIVGGDEANLARLTGLPLALFVGIALSLTLLSWLATALALKKLNRTQAILSLLPGLLLGAYLTQRL
jgi:hypothetical protein